MSFALGRLRLASRALLSPLEGVSDVGFRDLCAQQVPNVARMLHGMHRSSFMFGIRGITGIRLPCDHYDSRRAQR